MPDMTHSLEVVLSSKPKKKLRRKEIVETERNRVEKIL